MYPALAKFKCPIVVTEVIGVLIPMAFMWLWMSKEQSNEIYKPFEQIWNKLKMIARTRSDSDRRVGEATGIRHRDTIGSMRGEDGAANC